MKDINSETHNRNVKYREIKLKIEEKKEKLINLLPSQFRDRFREESFLGGGAIYSLYNDESPKDYDFFLDNEDLSKDIREYFVSYLGRNSNNQEIICGVYRDLRLLLTNNGITIGDFQIITRWSGSPREVIENFDFKHNMFYVYKGELGTFSQWDYLEDRVLRFNRERARDLTGCIIRVKKYIERGFTMTDGEMAEMLLRLNEKGFDDRELEILNCATKFIGS